MTIIISIGVDCGVAEMLKKYNLRKTAYPFDWIVTYHGVSEIIKNNFIDYIPEINDKTEIIDGKPNIFNDLYGTKFIHDNFPDKKEYEKYERRIKRFNDILNSKEDIIFIRKSHAYHNHKEYSIKNDYEEVIEFDNYLQEYYPNLKYTIYLILLCNNCYKNFNIKVHKNIKIYKSLITDIRELDLHNKLITGFYFEKTFISLFNNNE